MKTKVHRNLHKACWSVRRGDAKTAHHMAVVLSNVEFRVSQAGRAKVLEKKVRSVHAYAVGEVYTAHTVASWSEHLERVRYNPYLADSFQLCDGTPVRTAELAFFHSDGWAYVKGINL